MSGNSIKWTNEKRKLSELIPWPRNPRQIKSDQAKRLAQSFEQFGQVETIAIGPDNGVYNGHQRLNVLMDKHGGDYEIEVRVSSRELSEKEREKLTVFLHKGAAGEWDFDTLSEWDLPDLIEWGFSQYELGIYDAGSDVEKIPDVADYPEPETSLRIIVEFDSVEQRKKFADYIGIELRDGIVRYKFSNARLDNGR